MKKTSFVYQGKSHNRDRQSEVYTFSCERRRPVHDHGGVPQKRFPITQSAKACRRKMGNGGTQPSAMQSYQKSVALGGRKIIPHPRKNIPKTATGRL